MRKASGQTARAYDVYVIYGLVHTRYTDCLGENEMSATSCNDVVRFELQS